MADRESILEKVASILGVKDEPWRVALYLPTGWKDLRERDLTTLAPRTQAILSGRVLFGLERHSRPPRKTTMVESQGLQFPVTIFGEDEDWHALLVPGAMVHLDGQVSHFRDVVQFRADALVQHADVGKLIPIYPGRRGVCNAEALGELMKAALGEAIHACTEAIRERFAWWGDLRTLRTRIQASGRMEDLIRAAHRPASIQEGRAAQRSLEQLACLDLVREAQQGEASIERQPLTLKPLQPRLKAIPFALTTEQLAAVQAMRSDLVMAVTTSRVLVGDVGSGKSVCYQLAIASVADAGGRACVLLPNETLAQQIHGEVQSWWPDLDARCITGSSAADAHVGGRVLIGTTALLARDVGAFDLVVIDEQQKFSAAQREALCGGAHRIEVTATCIPRTQALLTYGTLRHSLLTQGHARKVIKTRLWTADQRMEALQELKAWVAKGHQLLVVYAKKASSKSDPRSVYRSLDAWERLAPGKVVVSTSDEGAIQKQNAADAMRSGQAQILVATTTIEVGVSLPELYRVVVVDPDRFGLTQLHQLRGRVARRGGRGYCDLLLGGPIKEHTQRRLDYFVNESSGFRIAEADLSLRGFGDLRVCGDRQSGAGTYLLGGRQPSPEDLEAAMRDLGPRADPMPAMAVK